MNLFHLAIPVLDLGAAKDFYINILGCSKGRSSAKWIDFNFYGHQLVCHEVKESINKNMNDVDGNNIPVPHFGIILDWREFHSLSTDLQSKNINFIIEPTIRFKGKVGEQAIMFLKDPSDNAIEFKSFKNNDEVFNI
ncbi:MAG: VOC family protein [SAR86 cluster bacterium]|jgi:extradiol dioxygenase family protein|uniref:VOC family protein n=1 Tax=SAR86 cluster bacterium TaxID=2030880 RepID=A0A937JH35_9GAMM|nr:VOC family protein [SAR86 cluster bacterium]MDG1721834.1 VOC family protein [SAR86 cluster bacterium]|tara:strand:+ start:447 stop:857 length:411 start_codon:yes stop_codon:yes gene_type:complete